MNALESAIAADPALSWRPREVTAEQRHDVRCIANGISLLVAEMLEANGPREGVDPDEAYAALNVLELEALAVRAPHGVGLVALACERERLLAEHGITEGQEIRAAVAHTWLRARLGAQHAA